MERIITSKNLRSFAYVNDEVCKKPYKKIVVSFMGLGGADMIGGDNEQGRKFGEQGILFVIPYLNPWSWMNEQAVRETDEIIDALLERTGEKSLPVVSSGGSMGGLACIVYTRYSAHKPYKCVANCPVCDLPYHYTERPDLPRTLYSAFGTYNTATLKEAMEKASPLHLARNCDMPDVLYYIFHCEEDKAVNKGMHSDEFVRAMKNFRRIEYYAVPGRGHCDLSPEMWDKYNGIIIND